MELPKNITQIGVSDRNCKIYVEDYVISYIKQINQLACNKDMAVALYGTRKTENNISYLFIYGACKLDFLQRETRHLSQAQQQEIEKLRRKYFPELEFQGYRLLNGEMVEGFHICEQDICRYIMGYAQFYEKNDGMLAYMLDTRATEAEPEVVNQEKYDIVRKRQEERREEHYRDENRREGVYRREDAGADNRAVEVERSRERRLEREKTSTQNVSPSIKRMRVSTVAVFGILCVAGLAMLWDGQNTEGLQVAARQAITDLTEQKLPDAQEVMSAGAEVSTLIAEDKLSEAVLAENDGQEVASSQQSQEGMIESETVIDTAPIGDTASEQVVASAVTPLPTAMPEPASTPEPTPEPTATPTPTPEPTATPQAASATVATASYVVQKGDTLIDICIRQYGTETMVKEVCALNDISDPDDIKVGEKILLP